MKNIKDDYTKKRKKILVCSDTHGKTENLEFMLKREQFDSLYFLGDGEGVENDLGRFAGCPAEIVIVRGNNDFNCSLPEHAMIELGNHRALLTHGHRYRLYLGNEFLLERARELECDVCLYGHLHRPVRKIQEGVLLLNPGSAAEPRQTPHLPTCLKLQIDKDGELSAFFLNAKTGEELNFASDSNN